MADPTSPPEPTTPEESVVSEFHEGHPFRLASLVTGLLVLLVAGLFLLEHSLEGLGVEISIIRMDAGVFAALVLLGAGCALLVKAMSRLAGRRARG